MDTSDIPEAFDCGLAPMQFNVVIAPVPVKNQTKSGIIFTDETKAKEAMRSMRGRIIAISPLAFSYAKAEEWGSALKPQVGDAVMFGRHAGVVLDPDDPASLRVVKDEDIIAVIR